MDILRGGDFFLVSGRWDNTVIVIDLKKAIDPANDGTPNAVINRLRVTPDIDTGNGKSGEQPVYSIAGFESRYTRFRDTFKSL